MEFDDILDRASQLVKNPEARAKIELPAIREVFEQVAEAQEAQHAYKKHTAHTKTNVKGCVVGCIAG